jgi:signal transduction histidine kinase
MGWPGRDRGGVADVPVDESGARRGERPAVSGAAEYTHTAARRTSFRITEFSVWASISLATVLGVVAVLMRSSAVTPHVAFPVVAFGAGSMFGLGLLDISRERDVRVGRVLVAGGVLWSLSALTASDRPLAYSVGHVCQWCVDVAIAYLLLTYPSGRLATRSDRLLLWAVGGIVGLLFVPTALIAQFPHPSLWSACTASCPRNVFSLLSSSPAFVQTVIVPVRGLLAVAVFVAVGFAVIRHMQKTEPALRQFYAPIAGFAFLQAVVFALYFPLRALAPQSGTVSALGWIFVLSLPAAGLASGTGRLYQRIHSAGMLERLARSLTSSSTAADIRSGLADALQDPSLQILHSFPGDSHAWVDESGAHVAPPRAEGTRHVTHISSGNWRIAIVHQAGLSEDPSLLVSAGSYALAALENQCLTDELRDSLHALAASRASRLTAEDDTRQKIERDLHDGAQQRLVALRVKLGLAATTLSDHDPAGAATLLALEKDVDATIDELRSLAQGIYPPLLARTGLGDALRVAGRSAALPTTVRADRVGRYSPEIETTVCFSCSEALQNAAKHAGGATSVTISIWQDDLLHFEVRDDGAGFDRRTTSLGMGLSNLRDRLAAVGGTVTLESATGQGTVLGGSVPLR